MKGFILLCVFSASVVLGVITFNDFSRDVKLEEEHDALRALLSIARSSDYASLCLTEYHDGLTHGVDGVTYADMVSITTKVLMRCGKYEPQSNERLVDARKQIMIAAGQNDGEIAEVMKKAESCIEYAVVIEGLCPDFFEVRRVISEN